MSLDEVASLVESSNEHDQSDPFPTRITKDLRVPTMSTTGSEQYESAVEELADKDKSTTVAPGVSFARPPEFPDRSGDESDRAQGIGKRLQYLTRRTIIDSEATEQNHDPISRSNSCQLGQMVLIINPTHSSISILAHAFLQSLVKTYPIVKGRIDTVQSTAWPKWGDGPAVIGEFDRKAPHQQGDRGPPIGLPVRFVPVARFGC